MINHYLNFNRNEKNSVMQSMFVVTLQFLNNYHWDLSTYQDDDELINDLYFFWLRTSAHKQYVWCTEDNDYFLSNEFAATMKQILKRTLLRELILSRQSLSRRNRSHLISPI
ncbi:hypothetical protein CN918_32550 [Priestia megaterium]|nr:hypothetical protein CN918_32550 [Priestia megaterium]